jgi:hypothetical protein
MGVRMDDQEPSPCAGKCTLEFTEIMSLRWFSQSNVT